MVLVLSIWPGSFLAQGPKPPSLEEQLRAQYETGTVLTIQKEGILGVAPASSKVCPARYQDGKFDSPEPSCAASVKSSSRALTVGEKIYPSKIDVDVAKERVSFRIVECDSCNKAPQPSSYKSQIDFQFSKGYLEQAGVSQIVDAIGEVLAFQEIAVVSPPPPPSPPGQTGGQPDDVLTNNDIVKMARVKLGDAIIISKIKASPCNFDTSVDALVKLKEAGVSDAVIQAMHDAQEAAKAPPEPAPPEPAPAGPLAGHYVNNVSAVEYLDLGFDGKFSLKAERTGILAGSYEVSGDALTLRRRAGTFRFRVDGERLLDDYGNSWIRRGEPALAQYANGLRLEPKNADLLSRKSLAEADIGNFGEAEEDAGKAIAAGGAMRFPVVHNHITGYCEGYLVLERGKVTFQPQGGDHGFSVTSSGQIDITESTFTRTNLPEFLVHWRSQDGKDHKYYMVFTSYLTRTGGSIVPKVFHADEESADQTARLDGMILRLVKNNLQ